MSDTQRGREPVERLAEEFLQRHRRGERPSLSDYTQAHPDLAEEIRDLFPAILFLEQIGSANPAVGNIPERIAEYTLLREVGRGGMGIVYEAVQEPLGRRVALKVLPTPTLAGPSLRERFLREARAAARLHHTHIVPVFGVGEADGIPYLAMQYIDGLSLDRAGQIEIRTAALLMAQAAEALHHAHEQGVLHRDIKPANLLLAAPSHVWVTDFGLARVAGDEPLTQAGDLVGTLRYMAPERFDGASDPRSDLYSLGVTLYELLTNRPAFPMPDRAQLVDAIVHGVSVPPRRLAPQIPLDLERIVLKAMACDPADRYASAGLLADDLRRFLADQPVMARPLPIHERLFRWRRRNPRLATMTALATLFLTLIVVGSPILLLRERTQRLRAEANEQTAEENRRGRLQELWTTHLARAAAARATSTAGRRFAALQSLDEARLLLPELPYARDRQAALRDGLLACLSLADLRRAQRWDDLPAATAGVAFDPPFLHRAHSETDGTIRIVRLDDNQERVCLPGPGSGQGAWTLRFSPDGRYLAAGYQQPYQPGRKALRIWDWQREEVVFHSEISGVCGDPAFSPDSRQVSLARGGPDLSLCDLESSNKTLRKVALSAPPGPVAFHPDGSRFAVVQQGIIELREVATGHLRTTWQQRHPPVSLAWRPDGSLLAATNGTAITLWDEATGQVVGTLRGHDREVSEVAFRPEGDLLASKGHDGTVRLWDLESRRMLVRDASIYTGCSSLQFSADGRRLAFGLEGDSLWVWDVASGRECRTVVPRRTTGWQSLDGSFTADGSVLIAGGTDGVRLWDCSTGRELAHVPLADAWSALLAEEGRQLLITNREGLYCCPLTREASQLRVGPPERLAEGALQAASTCSKGRFLLAARRDQDPLLIPLAHPSRAQVLEGHTRVHAVAISPDGRWAATGTWYGSGVKMWDLKTGKFERDLPAPVSATVTFQPEGHLLVIGTESEYSFWDVPTWRRTHGIAKHPEASPGRASFGDKGRLLAVRHSPSRLRLLEPTTGRLLAELGTPGEVAIGWHCLSPDGSRLAAYAGGLIHLWDLRLLREHLAERGLDWKAQVRDDKPGSPPAERRS